MLLEEFTTRYPDEFFFEGKSDELRIKKYNIEMPTQNSRKRNGQYIDKIKSYYFILSIGNFVKSIIYDEEPDQEEIEKQKTKFQLEVLL